MRASVVPSITPAHPPELFMKPLTVHAPSPAPTIQGNCKLNGSIKNSRG